MNIIEIKVDESLTHLIGYQYAREIFMNQIKDNIKQGCNNIIVFPEYIKRLAVSFNDVLIGSSIMKCYDYNKILSNKYTSVEIMLLSKFKGVNENESNVCRW